MERSNIDSRRQHRGVIFPIVVAMLLGTLAFVEGRSQTQKPPPTIDDIGAGILAAGGPFLDASVIEAVPGDPNNPNGFDFRVYLDAQGRAITKDGPVAYILDIHLSYMRDGSGGYAWSCVMLVTDVKTRLYTNGGSNGLSNEEFDKLLAGRPHWEAFNDPETIRKHDARLDRTVLDAVKNAFAKLNKGTTGTVLTNKPSGKK